MFLRVSSPGRSGPSGRRCEQASKYSSVRKMRPNCVSKERDWKKETPFARVLQFGFRESPRAICRPGSPGSSCYISLLPLEMILVGQTALESLPLVAKSRAKRTSVCGVRCGVYLYIYTFQSIQNVFGSLKSFKELNTFQLYISLLECLY